MEHLITLIWIIGTILPFVSATMVSLRLPGRLTTEERVLHSLILAVSLLMASLFTAGLITKVNTLAVAAIQLAAFICIFAATRKHPVEQPIGWKLPRRVEVVTTIAIVTVLVGLLGLAREAFMTNPGEDALAYHLPLAQWFCEHGLGSIPSVGDYRELYPANVSLLYSWFMCSGTKLIPLSIVSVFASVVLALGTFVTAVNMGLPRRTAVWAPALTLGNYLLFYQVRALYVDLTIAAFLVAAAAFIIGYSRSKDSALLYGTAVATGLALGSKPSGPVFVAFFAVLIALVSRGQCANRLQAIKQYALLLFVVYILGGFWYTRNLLFTDWGLFPPSDGLPLLQQTAILGNLPEFASQYGVPGMIRGVAGQASWVTALALVPLLILAVRAIRAPKTQQQRNWIFLVVNVVFIGLLLVHPYSARVGPAQPLAAGGDLRYGIAAIAMLNVCWVLLLARSPRYLPVLCTGLALPAYRIVFAAALAAAGLTFGTGRCSVDAGEDQ